MKRLDTALLLCNCLSFGGKPEAQADALRRELSSGTVEWESLVEVASHFLLSPALYGALSRKQLLSCIPDELRAYFSTLYDLNDERNRRFTTLTVEVLRCLNEAGVEPVLLKGAANIFSGLYDDPNLRYLSDIDLLVPAEKLIECAKNLGAAGFYPLHDPQAPYWKRHHHYPRLLKRDDYAGFELHRELFPLKYGGSHLDAGSVLRDAKQIVIGDVCARIPSATHQILCNVVHTQINDRSYLLGTISLRQLYDFVLLRNSLEGEIDWPDIASRFARNGYMGALSGYLLAGSGLFGQSLPQEIRATASGRLYYRWLCLQMSHLWALRIGSVARLTLQYFWEFRSLIEWPRVPKFFNRALYRNRYRQIAETLGRRW